MKFRHLNLILFSLTLLTMSFGYSQETYEDVLKKSYIPVDKDLYDTIVAMDKKLFDAYNSCDMDIQRSLYSDDLEFFHDQGGLNTSKEQVLASIEKNICGKVTRTLIEGSIEVYPIKDYGAIEMGYHSFSTKENPESKSEASRFIIIWKQQDNKWLVSRVVSIH